MLLQLWLHDCPPNPLRVQCLLKFVHNPTVLQGLYCLPLILGFAALMHQSLYLVPLRCGGDGLINHPSHEAYLAYRDQLPVLALPWRKIVLYQLLLLHSNPNLCQSPCASSNRENLQTFCKLQEFLLAPYPFAYSSQAFDRHGFLALVRLLQGGRFLLLGHLIQD